MAENTHDSPDFIASNIDAFAGDVVEDIVEPEVEQEAAPSSEAADADAEPLNYDPDDAALSAPVEEKLADSADTPKIEAEPADERDTLIAELRERDRLNQERLDKLIAGVSPAQQAQQAKPEPEPLGAAPDPVADPDGYTQWTEKRVEQMFAERDAKEQQRRYLEASQKVQDDLWNEFSTAHDEWADHPDLVRGAAEQAAAKLGASYTKQQLFEATHKNMVALREKLTGQKTPPQQKRKPVGLGVAPRAKQPQKAHNNEAPEEMVDQLRSLQADMGLISH